MFQFDLDQKRSHKRDPLKYRPSEKRLHRVAVRFMNAVSPRLRPRSQERYSAAIDNMVVALGPMDIGAVTPEEIVRAVGLRLKDGAAMATVQVEWSVLREFFRWAVRVQICEKNPTDKLRANDLGLMQTPYRLRWLEDDEWSKLMDACGEDQFMKDAIIFAAATGLRWENQFRLTRERVFLDRRELFIPAKDYKTWRNLMLPFDQDAHGALERRLAYIAQAKHAHQGWFVFGYIDQFDECLRPYKWFYKRFQAVLKRAGIKDFTWHDFRHHRASTLIRNGVDLLPTKDLMGHGSIRTTLKYASLSNKNLHEIVKTHWEKINAARTSASVRHQEVPGPDIAES